MNQAQFRTKQDHWRLAINTHKKSNGRSLDATTIRVAHALQHFEHSQPGDDQGTCFPSLVRVAALAGIGGTTENARREARRKLRILEQEGFIVKLREGISPTVDRPGQTAKWRLVIPEHAAERLRDLPVLGNDDAFRPENPGTLTGKSEHNQEGVGGYSPRTSGLFTPETVGDSPPLTSDVKPPTGTSDPSNAQNAHSDHSEPQTSFEPQSEKNQGKKAETQPIGAYIIDEKNNPAKYENYYNKLATQHRFLATYEEAVTTFKEYMTDENRSDWLSTFKRFTKEAMTGRDIGDLSGDCLGEAAARLAMIHEERSDSMQKARDKIFNRPPARRKREPWEEEPQLANPTQLFS